MHFLVAGKAPLLLQLERSGEQEGALLGLCLS